MSGIAKVKYSHDAMIDQIIQNPQVSQNQLAAMFGYTVGWVSQVVNSDAFRERLAERKEEVVDPLLRMSLEERIRGAVDLSLQVIMQKLSDGGGNINAAIRVLEHGSRALGYGAQQKQPQVTVQNYVAIVPPKSLDGASWVESHKPAASVAGQSMPTIVPTHEPAVLDVSDLTIKHSPGAPKVEVTLVQE